MIRAVCLSTLSLMLFGCLGHNQTTTSDNLSFTTDITMLDRSETIIGIDRNKNGIRDDIELIIRESYEEPLTKQLVLDLAKSLQDTLAVDPANEKQVVRAYAATEQSINCLGHHLGDNDLQASKVAEGLSELTHNTGPRFSHAVSFENALTNIQPEALPKLHAC